MWSGSPGWFQDAVSHLGLKETPGVHEYSADYGELPDFTKYNPEHDALFTYNGTTSGARLPDCDWVPADRKGLTFNDATSAAFAMEMPWDKLDVTTYSWQKVRPSLRRQPRRSPSTPGLCGMSSWALLCLGPDYDVDPHSDLPTWTMPRDVCRCWVVRVRTVC